MIWQELLRKLSTYKQVYGHCNVPYPFAEDPLLSQWVINVRQSKSRLPDELLEALTAMGFDFTPASGWYSFYGRLQAFHRQHGHLNVPGNQKEYQDLRAWIHQQRQVKSLLTREQVEQLEGLGFDWEGTPAKALAWQAMYDRLLAFKSREGHCRVPATYATDRPLAKWVARQRATEDSMPKERKALLEQIGFSWKRDMAAADEQAWRDKFHRLAEFARQYGHFKVPSGQAHWHSLRIWMDKQRQLAEQLPAERRQLLSSIGFPWQADIAQEMQAQWQQMCNALVAFHQQHGHCRVSSHGPADASLGAWVTRQRRRKSMLTPEQRMQLDGIGFDWAEDIKKEKQQQWLSLYRELKAYKEKYGHTRVPSKDPNHYTLSRWVSWQRKRKAENQLSSRRIERLNQIGFDWDVNRERDNERRWERMYLRLKRFYRKHGHSKVPENYPADKKLAIWVGMQRQYEWRLSADRKQRLKDLHFVFQADLQKHRDGTWEEMFDKLQAFQQVHGHCRVTINHPDGKLFRWVAKQRRLDKQEKLSPKRKERLDELGFTWIEDTQKRLTDRWQMHFAQLLVFQERYGHLQVPEGWAENPKLARWVADQRRKEHRLPADRKQLLDAAGFPWSLDLSQQKERDWEEKYHQLAGFQQRFGHCRVPVDWSENTSLGIWVFRQRKQYRLGKLPIHRQQQLDQLGFSWEVNKGPESKKRQGV